jgi:hypothetical protein
VDSSGIAVQNAYVRVQRYYPGDNAYKTVAVGKTDIEGKTVIPLRAYDVFYKFIIIQDGTIKRETETMQVTSTDITIPLTTEGSLIFNAVSNIAYYCTYINSTNTIKCTVSDPTGLMQSSILTVTKLGTITTTTVCNTTLYTSDATHLCQLAPTGQTVNGTYSYSLLAEVSDGSTTATVNLESGYIEFQKQIVYGLQGVLIALLFMIMLIFAGAIDIRIGMLAGAISVWVVSTLELLPLKTSTIISVFVLAGLGIWRMSR